jgi:hypothetical protein
LGSPFEIGDPVQAFDHVVNWAGTSFRFRATNNQIFFFDLNVIDVTVKRSFDCRPFVAATQGGQIHFFDEIELTKHSVHSNERVGYVINFSPVLASANRSSLAPFVRDPESSFFKSTRNISTELLQRKGHGKECEEEHHTKEVNVLGIALDVGPRRDIYAKHQSRAAR